MPYSDGSWRPPGLVVDVEAVDSDTCFLVARGEIDVSTAPALEQAFREQANGGGSARIVLDLEGVAFMDSTGLSVIAEWRDVLVDGGGAFALVAVDPNQQRLFRLTELTERLGVSGSRDEAVSALDKAGSAGERADRSA